MNLWTASQCVSILSTIAKLVTLCYLRRDRLPSAGGIVNAWQPRSAPCVASLDGYQHHVPSLFLLNASSDNAAMTSAWMAMLRACSTASAPQGRDQLRTRSLRASPSFAFSLMGRKSWDERTVAASVHPVSGLHILPSPSSPRARCARGAKSPERHPLFLAQEPRTGSPH